MSEDETESVSEERRHEPRRAEDQHILAVVESALKTINTQLKWIVFGGSWAAITVKAIVIGAVYLALNAATSMALFVYTLS